jgi:hypothetical protein
LYPEILAQATDCYFKSFSIFVKPNQNSIIGNKLFFCTQNKKKVICSGRRRKINWTEMVATGLPDGISSDQKYQFG